MTPKMVLPIEDSPEYAELVRRWLAPQDGTEFVLTWADSPIGGLDHLKKGGVDAILLDPGLPDSRGLGTFNATRMHPPDIPIIITEQRRQAVVGGANGAARGSGLNHQGHLRQ
jgi:DNA-binding response OmpR family regulator